MIQLTLGPTFHGACDASGGVLLDGHILAVANDEDNVIRYYDLNAPDQFPIEEDWSEALGVEGPEDELECDLESATELDGLIFWIGSHSRSRKGKERLNRHRLFATKPKGDGRLKVVQSSVCTTLLDTLLDADQLAAFHLHEAAAIAPKEPGGLNIESLCDTAAGRLLIGFRNPIPDGLALAVPVNNPKEVAAGKVPKLDVAIRLDLGGLGLRDMVRDGSGGYLILAGGITDPAQGAPNSRLFTWAGPGMEPVAVGEPLVDFNPEGLIVCGTSILVVSDDGARSVAAGSPPCKETTAPQRCFRTMKISGWP